MKHRCGAPLISTSDKRRKFDTCRHIVQEGTRCHRHRDVPVQEGHLAKYDELARKVFG